jgi:general L-amino acid transport system substrate-binding protein
MTFKPVVIEKVEEIRAAFYAGRCDVYTTDASGLYSTRAANTPAPLKPEDFIILPEIISKEPLGPAVRQGDNQFADIVRWAFYAMVEAEEYGITSKNVDEMLKSENPTIKRILGHGQPAQDRARPQCAVEQGRPSVRPADPLSARSRHCVMPPPLGAAVCI